MIKQFLKDSFGWGIVLWLIGYALGMVFFTIVPNYMIGWIVSPIGIIISLWVLFKKIHAETFEYYLWMAIIWTLIAVIFDYFFLVKPFTSTAVYYKLDVYIYYGLTLVLPLIAYSIKHLRQNKIL